MREAPSRRAFFRSLVSTPAPSGIRPPWAAADFTDRCDRCLDCVKACPERVLGLGDGGFPVLNPAAGGCSFCGDCVTVCKPAALADHGQRALPAVAAIGAACIAAKGVDCRICGDRCEACAIRFRPQVGGRYLPTLDLSACTGCGACVAPCPVSAIAMEDQSCAA